MSQDGPLNDDQEELAPPARITRATMLGCLGLACVLLTLPLLWLAVGIGGGWLAHVLPLLAFVAAIGGAALTLVVPASHVTRSSDPQRPTTHQGGAPMLERPAAPANRLCWATAAFLIVCAVAGFGAESLTGGGAIWGLALMLVAGALLLALGGLIGFGLIPPPALRWLRLSIYSGPTRQSVALLATGFVTIGGALFLALLDGRMWGVLGLALLVAALAFMAPLARRIPRDANRRAQDDSVHRQE
jgi:hypothetical protein